MEKSSYLERLLTGKINRYIGIVWLLKNCGVTLQYTCQAGIMSSKAQWCSVCKEAVNPYEYPSSL